MHPLRKIISGGQTGVDRAALDCAIRAGVPHGGTVPLGCAAEDGPIDRRRYPGLSAADTADPAVRTRRNVEAADGTLVLTRGPPDVGTALTIRHATDLGRPLVVIDLAQTTTEDAAAAVRAFVAAHGIAVLNVAGPRESNVPGGIYAAAVEVLTAALPTESER